MTRLEHKRVVIAGATSGIGRALVTLLAAEQADVTAIGRDPKKLAALRQELPAVKAVSLDARHHEDVAAFFSKEKDIDHLVLALSGGKGAGEFRTLSLSTLREAFDDKFWPQLDVLQTALPCMKPGGSITLITAISATAGLPGTSGLELVPNLRTRISALNGEKPDESKVDPDVRWILKSERGLTYAATPPSGSHVVAGEWWPADYQGPALVSVDADLAAGLHLKLGDSVTYNIAGRDVTARIANFRKIDWTTLGINFFSIFAPGTLEAAPQTAIATVHADSFEHEEKMARAVTEAAREVRSGARTIQEFDASLRGPDHRLNPGTTADLVAGTLLAALLTGVTLP